MAIRLSRRASRTRSGRPTQLDEWFEEIMTGGAVVPEGAVERERYGRAVGREEPSPPISLWRCPCGGLFTDPERVPGRPVVQGMTCHVCRSRARQRVFADVRGWTRGRDFRARLRVLKIKVAQARWPKGRTT